MRRFGMGLAALLFMAAAPAWGDPGKYPEYAKVESSDKIAVRYSVFPPPIGVEGKLSRE